MRTLLITLVLIFAGANAALADYGGDRDSYGREGYNAMSGAARRLDNVAAHFYRQLKHEVGHKHATRDAARLAAAARHFHRQVERGRARSDRQLRQDYAKLVRTYSHAREEFGGRGDLRRDRTLRRDFRAVERAFDNLGRAISYARNNYPSRRADGTYGGQRNRQEAAWQIVFQGVFGH